jgi:uncharacterized paraquat-inducible protein A
MRIRRNKEEESVFVDTRYCSICQNVQELDQKGNCTKCGKHPNTDPQVEEN